MGIKNFTKAIKRVAPESIVTKDASNLRGSVVGVDISLSLYQVVCGINTTLTHKDRDVTHIYGLYKRFSALKSCGANLVAVLDGKPPEMKNKTLERRATKPSRFRITKQHIEDVGSLCDVLGIPVLQAKGEADVLLASLYENKQIDYIFSNDGDIVVYGGRKLIRSLRNNMITILDGDILLQGFRALNKDFSATSLIELGCLLGNDYNDNPKNIGVVRALNGMIKHNDMEKVLLDNNRSSDLPNLRCSKEIFLNAHKVEEPSKINFEKPDATCIRNYLRDVVGVREDKITASPWCGEEILV